MTPPVSAPHRPRCTANYVPLYELQRAAGLPALLKHAVVRRIQATEAVGPRTLAGQIAQATAVPWSSRPSWLLLRGACQFVLVHGAHGVPPGDQRGGRCARGARLAANQSSGYRARSRRATTLLQRSHSVAIATASLSAYPLKPSSSSPATRGIATSPASPDQSIWIVPTGGAQAWRGESVNRRRRTSDGKCIEGSLPGGWNKSGWFRRCILHCEALITRTPPHSLPKQRGWTRGALP